MNLSAGRRTWEEATSPAAVLLAQKYERAWRDSDHAGRRPSLQNFLGQAGAVADGPGAQLALLRADMALRWETGERVGAQWYLDRYPALGEDTLVALVYEEFCLREEDDEHPDAAEYLNRYPKIAGSLRRVLQIHDLVGSGTPATATAHSIGDATASCEAVFPEAGQTIGGFSLVEELGRGAFARVFLARERQLADRPVALKVTRRGSREPQTLARLQHTHIVPVHSHRIDAATGLHLLCMPYFGRVTLARILADKEVQAAACGAVLAHAIDRLEPLEAAPSPRSTGRSAFLERSYPRAIAWWGARLAEALDHAHDRGVLHRDVKPSNVLVTADGMPMLLDFNLAGEPVFQNEAPGGEPILGGTIDYMPPEHLNALAAGSSEGVDSRGDIYGLGVVLFECLTGKRPFASPRRGGSMVDLLNRAALDRFRALPRLRDRHPEIPDALETVVRRCLAPEPEDRYQRAGFLAADLQAVADDLPLPHTREAWPRRAAAWVRRRRVRISAVTTVAVLISALLAGGFGLRVQQANLLRQASLEADTAQEALDRRDYAVAKARFDASANLAERSALTPWSYLLKINDFRQIGGRLHSKFQEFQSVATPEELMALALVKSKLAERTGLIHQKADELFEAADHLRFQLLLDEGSELTQATLDLQKVLAPFFVLENPEWTELPHSMLLLDAERRVRLVRDVNELLFLWMAAIDESAGDSPQLSRNPGSKESADLLAPALELCERAIAWVEPKPPWVALAARLRASQALASRNAPADTNPDATSASGEPRDVNRVDSPLACFQWGVLAYRGDRLSRAIEWLERAARLDGGGNYWYQFLLGYLEDKAGYTEDAFRNYSVAAALRQNSPWLLFSLARIYRVRGQWYWARRNITAALEQLKDRPEATQVRLEMAYLHQQVGDFTEARREYDRIIASDRSGIYSRAARLNLANMDAESGAPERARQAYDALILEDLTDVAARKSRALLELRLGQAERAAIDLTALLDGKTRIKNRGELLAEQALAYLLMGKADEAVADATDAQRERPTPAHERLRQRALLAAHRVESLQLERPEELRIFAVGGHPLTRDLRAAAVALGRAAQTHPDRRVRAALNQAVICAALGEHKQAQAAATIALDASPQSARAFLIRARVHHFAGERALAWVDVERGLLIQPTDPGLLELRGVLQAASGDAEGALESYTQAASWGSLGQIHLRKAAAQEALGRSTVALREWSLALRSDPELPEAYLGRARLAIRLKDWDLALADLEQAAAWAQSDPMSELAIAVAYLKCLPGHPNHFGRWLVLVNRTIQDGRRLFLR